MKKILLLFAAIICAAAGWAQDEVSAKYSGKTLDVELANSTQFVAFQMDITLPSGVSVVGVASNIERLEADATASINGENVAAPFEIKYNVVDPATNKLRVIAYNLGNYEINGTSGKLFTLTFNNDVTEATIDNILFVNKALVEQTLAEAIATKGASAFDVNGDGKVLTSDAILVLKMITGEEPKTDAGDVNGDGKVLTSDALAILRAITGE